MALSIFEAFEKRHFSKSMNSASVFLNIPYPPKTMDWQPKRSQVVSEIISSERQYVQHLYHFIYEFRVALASVSKQGLIKNIPDTTEDLFMKIAPIYKINLAFLTILESSIKPEIFQSKIGYCFNSYATIFKIYTDYATGFNEGVSALEKQFQEDPHLGPAIESCQSNVGITLLELLRCPIERITRYRLLLLQLLRVTPREHSDRADCVAAYIQLSPMASPFKSLIIKQGESTLKALDSKYPGLSLPNKDRFLMFDSTMKCFTGTNVETCKLWLFNDCAMVSIPASASPVLFPIKNIKARHVDVPSPYENGADFLTSIDSFRVVFDSAKRKEAFIETCNNIRIDRSMDDTTDKEEPLAPVWTSLSDVVDCMLCGRGFGLVTKRIHCNFCRKCFCKRCITDVDIKGGRFRICKSCKESGLGSEALPHMLIDYSKSGVFEFQRNSQ
ncbi:RhoGEF domain containing protein [Histomonas meleagridis]|uniref:RhoGEF domain containing protein n=1 Tax=Histomonas meleagridis TaxID=135588 RepID=UPI00355A1150|nr:RhoGEF domain containing protein [Histomonas meleagridis]KAH0798473.1 RhoGEF domain containing protein [Histomonas meleagridis]